MQDYDPSLRKKQRLVAQEGTRGMQKADLVRRGVNGPPRQQTDQSGVNRQRDGYFFFASS